MSSKDFFQQNQCLERLIFWHLVSAAGLATLPPTLSFIIHFIKQFVFTTIIKYASSVKRRLASLNSELMFALF